MDARENCKPIAGRAENKCFGCGEANPSGLHMKFYERVGEETVVSWIHVPDHMCGYKTMVHGGIVAAILDEIMSKTAAHFLHEHVVTKSISVDYLKPVTTDIEIRAEAKVVRVEKNKVFVEGNIFDGDNRIRSKSTGIFFIVTQELMARLNL